MKSRMTIFSKFIVDILHENPLKFHLFTFWTLLVPLTIIFTLLSWNLQILVFLSFGYSSSFIGYHISNGANLNTNPSLKYRKHYRLIAENLRDIVIIHRLKDGKNEYINSATKSILGYLQNDLIGQSTIFIIHPEDRKKVNNQLINIKSLENYFFVETVRVRCKNNQFKWMELNVKTLKNEFGNSTFAIFTFRDISETIEIEKANKLFAEELYEKYINKDQNHSKQLIPIEISNR